MPQFVYYFNGLPLTGWVFKIHDFFCMVLIKNDVVNS